MNAKEELKQVRFKIEKVEETLEEYERYKTRAEKMTAVMSETTARTNKPSDKVGDNAAIMADLAIQYQQRWADAEYERLRISGELDKVAEPYRTLLFKRYVQGLNFETVASEMYYSYTTITKMHGKALILYERRNEQ